MTDPAGILVAGAGPAGLVLALQAHDHGAVVRIIERRPDAVRPSRALIPHARTLLADAELDSDLADDAARVVAGRRGLLLVFRLGVTFDVVLDPDRLGQVGAQAPMGGDAGTVITG
jgi:2-polyprenyl-6-methoxyphenol hydroxylase-like FAD-dependent oxidoreductase